MCRTTAAACISPGRRPGIDRASGAQRQPLILDETRGDPRWIAADESLHSALFVPVIHEERLLGVISLFSDEPNAFTQEHARDMMTLANNVAIAVKMPGCTRRSSSTLNNWKRR
ncbi:MAG: GAF domain-containing protein [bacterium]|nr:GAF domain-containing protein [bacterium]